jgi:hypothetical protein
MIGILAKRKMKMANIVDLRKAKFGLADYGGECALTRIDIPAWRTDAKVRWTFELMFEIHPSKRGVDGEGHRACGFARAALISNPPEIYLEYPLVDIGDTIITPYGEYRVEWYSQTNHDNLKLIECQVE